jgi:hypothetical protein
VRPGLGADPGEPDRAARGTGEKTQDVRVEGGDDVLDQDARAIVRLHDRMTITL